MPPTAVETVLSSCSMPLDPPATFRQYRAPQENGQALIEPAWFELPAVVEKNRAHLASIECELLSRQLSDVSASARRGLFEKALKYTRSYRDLPVANSEFPILPHSPVILSGHQPQLYHAGVWYKNFVLGELARRVQGVGIHLVIDSDLCRSTSIRVPAGSVERPHAETVSFDLPAREVPYEERAIRDHATLESFAKSITEKIAPFVGEPLVKTLWPLVVERSREEANLGLCLAQGRHLLEATMQSETLELPQSAVCQLPEFAWFVMELLANLPRFQCSYNSALADYRAAHHIRNRAHPVPDLATDQDGWREAPFWLWSTGDPTRRPLFARRRANSIEITDRHQERVTLELSDDDATGAVEQLQELANQGLKIRTRALTTTLFARLILGDLFLHGIGGAKYDQVTNLIARRFFGVELPEFAAVSATLRLPMDRPGGEYDADLSQRLRELRFHPERFLENGRADAISNDVALQKIIAAKRHWVDTPKSPQNARERHLSIEAANDALQPYVRELRDRWERELRSQEAMRPAAALFASREYSFCLQPRDYFERMLLDDLASR